jgi:flagellar biosynthesis protein FliQ
MIEGVAYEVGRQTLRLIAAVALSAMLVGLLIGLALWKIFG